VQWHRYSLAGTGRRLPRREAMRTIATRDVGSPLFVERHLAACRSLPCSPVRIER
jgi:hypothetical protein